EHAFSNLQFQPVRRPWVDVDHLLDLVDEATPAQLQRRNIYRHSHLIEPRGVPTKVVFHRFAQRPAPYLMDQSGLFQDRNELPWGDETGTRIVPSHQRLGAGELAALQANLRLIMENEFPPRQGQPEKILHRQPAGNLFGHSRSVKEISIAARLCLLERRLAVLE